MNRVSQRVSEVKKELYRILPTLKRISQVIEGEFSAFKFDGQDEDEHFLIQQLRSLPIDDLVNKLEYLQGQIVPRAIYD
jgi:hypothetical protein